MLGIVPAAGIATRLQPLGGSKELLPLGWAGKRLRVVADYLLERMEVAGVDRVCMVIAPQKADLLRFFAASPLASRLFFVVQPKPAGLCDAVFRAAPFVAADEHVLIGLPDTVWLPQQAYAHALRPAIHLITFPVEQPEHFDAVIAAAGDRVARVEVKRPGDTGRRVWGAITAPGSEFLALHRLWRERHGRDEYLGDLFNAAIAAGQAVTFDQQGTHYWDIGTPAGYARAWQDLAWSGPTAADAIQAA